MPVIKLATQVWPINAINYIVKSLKAKVTWQIGLYDNINKWLNSFLDGCLGWMDESKLYYTLLQYFTITYLIELTIIEYNKIKCNSLFTKKNIIFFFYLDGWSHGTPGIKWLLKPVDMNNVNVDI